MEQLSPSPTGTYWDDPGTLPTLPRHDRLTQPSHVAVGPASASCGRIPEDQSIFHYCEGNLNFSTAHSEDDEYFHKRKLSRDPMSHRIIEKRRRDRMNNCLADLSRLIPAEYLKKGRGRVEKTEIIEMAIKHMQYLQSRASLAADIDCSRSTDGAVGLRVTKCEQSPVSERGENTSLPENVHGPPTPPPSDPAIRPVVRPIVTEHYRLGYQECLSEAMHFLVEVEGFFVGDSLCVKLISHLQKHCDKIVKGDRLNFPRTRQPGEATSSSGSSSSYGPTGNSNCSSSGSGSGSGNAGSSASVDSGVVSKGTPMSTSPEETASAAHPHLGSHLRDILCSSPPSPNYPPPHPMSLPLGHLGHHAMPQHYDSCTDTEAPDGHEGHESSAHLDPFSPHHHAYADSHHHNSYKFKNTIKQRFSEEHGNGSGLLKRRRTMTRSPPPSPASPAPTSATAPPSSSQPSSPHTLATVPIFVLHSKGAFYIPLSVSHDVLAPYLDVDVVSDTSSTRSSAPVGGGCSSLAQVPPNVVLHPVTISVNFQQYVKQPPPPSHTPHLPAVPTSLTHVATLHPHPPHSHVLVPPPQTTPPLAPGHPWVRTDSGSFISASSSSWELSARQ